MPHSRPMPVIGTRCHELRIADGTLDWRVVYRVDRDAVLVLDVFAKRTQETPSRVIEECRKRLRRYELAAREEEK